MVKDVKIGEETITLKSSAALPYVYRGLIGREFFQDILKVETDVGIAFDMAFVMYRHGNPEDHVEEEPFMERFGLMDMANALPEIIDILLDEHKTSSESKKKSED